MSQLPGEELVAAGVADLELGRESTAALVVAMAASRLRQAGIDVPRGCEPGASYRLYAALCAERGDDAHSRYNALVGRIVSFARAAERASSS